MNQKTLKIFYIIEILLIGIMIVNLIAGNALPIFLSNRMLLYFHIIGGILLIGNGVVTAFYLVILELTKNKETFTTMLKMVLYTDLVFTGPGIILLFLSGSQLTIPYGIYYEIQWLLYAIVSFGISGIIWTAILIPLQFWFLTKVEEGIFPWESAKESILFKRALISFNVCGSISLALIFYSLYLMVVRNV